MEANEVRRGSKETLLLIDHFLFPGYTRPRLRYKFSLRTKIITIVSDPSAIPSGKKLASRHRSIAPIYLLFATIHRRRNLHAYGIPKTIRMQLTAVETYACWGVTRVNPAHVNMNHWTRIPRFKSGGRRGRRGAASNGLEIRIGTAVRCVVRCSFSKRIRNSW